MKKRRLQMKWTCSDFVKHSHRWKWSAWLCGRWQYQQECAKIKVYGLVKDIEFHSETMSQSSPHSFGFAVSKLGYEVSSLKIELLKAVFKL